MQILLEIMFSLMLCKQQFSFVVFAKISSALSFVLVTVTIKSRKVTVVGPRGTLERSFTHQSFDMFVKGLHFSLVYQLDFDCVATRHFVTEKNKAKTFFRVVCFTSRHPVAHNIFLFYFLVL
jgi:hypothetical protein